MIRQKSRSIGLRVEEAENYNAGRSLCFIDQRVVQELRLLTGDIIEIKGNKRTTGIVIPSIVDRGKNIIRLDSLQQLNAGVALGDLITINKIEVALAEEIELTPTSAEIDLKGQKEAIKTKLIDKPVVMGDLIEVLGVRYQESDPNDPVNRIMKLFSKSLKKRNFLGSMLMVVENAKPSNKIVKITRDTKVLVNDCIAILNKRGDVESYKDPEWDRRHNNRNRRLIKDLLSYTENLEGRINHIETEKHLLNLERQKLEYGKRILNDAIERLTNITSKLLESPLFSNARHGNLEKMYEEGGINEFKNLENLNRNLTKLEKLVSDNSSGENSQNIRYCKYCGGEVEDNQIFCRHCGTRIN